MKSFISILIMFIVLGCILFKGIERSEIVECEKWVRQSKEYVNWYSTDWQKAQCNHYQIDLK